MKNSINRPPSQPAMNNKARLLPIILSFLTLSFFALSLSSCEKIDEILEENDINPEDTLDPYDSIPPFVFTGGCITLFVSNENFIPLDTYIYFDDVPFLLRFHKVWNDLTDEVKDTYLYDYNPYTTAHEVTEIKHWVGDVTLDEVNRVIEPHTGTTKYFYTHYNEFLFTLDSAQVFSYYPEDSLEILSGTIYYEYDEDGKLLIEEYLDFVINIDTGSEFDNYWIKYYYNDDGNLITKEWYDYNDAIQYYEEYTLSPYLQGNVLNAIHPDMIYANRFAPASITAWYAGLGQYTYNFSYQVNDFNWIIQQNLITGTDTTALKMYGLECL